MEFTTRLGLHSQTTRLQGKSVATTPGSHGPNTLTGRGPDQGDIDARTSLLADFPNTTVRRPHGRRFGAGLFPLHSPLLRESLLVSFPPLIDMLKFSGCSRLISGRSEMLHKATEHFRTLGRDTRRPVPLGGSCERARRRTELEIEHRVAVRGSMRRNESRTRGPSLVRPVCTWSRTGTAQREAARPCELNAQARAVAIDVKPTLRQAWSREDPGPQYAFKMSMFNESCNSH